jgi:hypothetical protein
MLSSFYCNVIIYSPFVRNYNLLILILLLILIDNFFIKIIKCK